jgi:N-acetyl sugar amidotransferase
MDASAGDIRFDAAGVCSYCTAFLERAGHIIRPDPETQRMCLDRLVNKIKHRGRRKRYDCIVGVSGGVDSSWVLIQAIRLGLRPLAVHMDNGWNSELAQNNIANLVRGLGVDLHTHVINWLEYRGLMQAFFDADVIDVELLYDNAMLAVNFQMASKMGVRHILSGVNHATEGMVLPKDWVWNKFDKRNIVSIGRRNGMRLETFPGIGTLGRLWYGIVRGIRWETFLDLVPFNKFEALQVLERDFSYKPYPYKHYESVFTRFYQGHILPVKFGVDKRRVHLSTLVISGQMTRAQALQGLQGIAYPSQEALEEDRAYFLKKMGWTSSQLDDYLGRPARPHDAFGSEARMFEFCIGLRDKWRG